MELKGSLKNFPLPDIIQLIGMGKRTGMLMVDLGEGQASIFFDAGEMTHAEYGDLQGAEVIYQLFKKKQGYFQFTSDVESDKRSIRANWMNVVMEAARRFDEEQKRRQEKGLREEGFEEEVAAAVGVAVATREEEEIEEVKEVIAGEVDEADESPTGDVGVAVEEEREEKEEPEEPEEELPEKILEVLAGPSPAETKKKMMTVLTTNFGRKAKKIEDELKKAADDYETLLTFCDKIEKYIFVFIDNRKAKEVADQIRKLVMDDRTSSDDGST